MPLRHGSSFDGWRKRAFLQIEGWPTVVRPPSGGRLHLFARCVVPVFLSFLKRPGRCVPPCDAVRLPVRVTAPGP